MLLKPIIVSMGLAASASATLNYLFGRQTTMPIPTQCTSQCPILSQIFTLSAAAFGPFCNTDTQQQIIACYTCIETNAPDELPPAALSYAQTAINNFENQCANLGSPIPSVTIPGATGTAFIPTDASGAASLTASLTFSSTSSPTATAGGSAAAPSNTTTSRSGAVAMSPQTLGASMVVGFATLLLFG